MTILRLLAAACLVAASGAAFSGPACQAESPVRLTPVIELYTSEGCSSCPPADRWLSTLRQSAAGGKAVVQAFHVGYWDYIGWVDRFANPVHTARQKQVAASNGLSGIYTPQVVRNGRDWRDFARTALTADEPAQARISMRGGLADAFEADIAPADPVGRWSAYWTVTEDGHSSKVKSGENVGEFLKHDFVVRQYVLAGDYQGMARLVLRAVPNDAGHPRRVNLVVYDKVTGKPLQALGVDC